MIKIKDIIEEMVKDPDYQSLKLFTDQNVFESYYIMGELLNPERAYKYEGQKGWFEYFDIMNNKYFVRMTYNPTLEPYYELKTGWYDENGNVTYNPPIPQNATAKDWDKRSDTLAKIFRDEIIPMFLKQDLCDVMKILPLEIKRYQLSIRMVNKFVPKDKIEIIENKPKEIILKKK